MKLPHGTLKTLNTFEGNGTLDEYRKKFSIKTIAGILLAELEERLDGDYSVGEIYLAIEKDRPAQITFDGETVEYLVPGILALCGTFIVNSDGVSQTVKIAPVFVSHPFWQRRRIVLHTGG